MKDNLDFIIIGAQKSGTTSFFKYLEGHPKIAMPLSKEAPYFTTGYFGVQTWDSYAKENFKNASNHQLWGKVTPHYMCDDAIPKRILDAMPEVKLIAILRNPIDRAYSHYRMAVYRGWEKRSFEDAIQSLSSDANQKEMERTAFATPEREICSYLAWGEYGRILSNYTEHFSRDNILILFTEDLSHDPQITLDRFLQHLNLPKNYSPKNIGQRYRVGSQKHRYSQLLAAKDAIQARIPSKLKRLLENKLKNWFYWFEEKNISSESKEVELTEPTRQRLAKYFQEDVRLLSKSFGLTPPWGDFKKE